MPLIFVEGNNRYVLVMQTLPEVGIVRETHNRMAIPCRRHVVNQMHQPIFQTAHRKPMNNVCHERWWHVTRVCIVAPRHPDLRTSEYGYRHGPLPHAGAGAITVSRNRVSRRALYSSHW